MPSPPRILYQSPRLRVVYQPADSDWLAFSFNGGEFDEKGLRFFGDTYFAKRKVAAIGFVDTHSRWFPKDDVAAALRVIQQVVSAGTYQRSVTYGVSMGAWGALKYSKMLGAHAALAFGPQWSINPSLVKSFDDRYERFYDPELHAGMEIVPDDLCPNNYIFFDPLFPPDLHHAERISAHPNVHRILQTFLGHPGIGYYTQTRLVDKVFALARQDSPDLLEFRRLVRSKRAESTIYWMGRADALKRKRGLYHLNWLVRSYEAAHAASDVPIEHPDAIEPLVGLTKVLLDAGFQDKAEANLALLWTKALAGASHADLGQLFVRLGAFDRARAVSEQAVRRNPRSLDARLELVRTLISTGDLQKANTEIDIVRSQAQERPIIWKRLRMLYARLGRREDVIAADKMLAGMPPPTRTRQAPGTMPARAPAAQRAAAPPPVRSNAAGHAPSAPRPLNGAPIGQSGPRAPNGPGTPNGRQPAPPPGRPGIPAVAAGDATIPPPQGLEMPNGARAIASRSTQSASATSPQLTGASRSPAAPERVQAALPQRVPARS